jgi:phosphatidylglycerophosphate synthase
VVGPKDADAILEQPVRDGRVLGVADGLVHVLTPAALDAAGDERTVGELAAGAGLDTMAPKLLVAAYTGPDRRKAIEHGLVQGLLKPLMIDGLMGVYFQRPITTRVSRLLSRTPITPNQLTAVAALLGISSGFFVAAGGPLWTALGGLLFLVGSLVDCLDGEIARLKFQFSKTGEWFDTIADDLSTTSFIAGMAVNVYHAHTSPMVAWAGVAAVGFFLLIQAYQYWKCIFVYHTGDLCAIDYTYGGKESSKLGDALKLLVKRDLFSLLFCITAFAGVLEFSFVISIVGGFGALIGIGLQAWSEYRTNRTPGSLEGSLLTSAQR